MSKKKRQFNKQLTPENENGEATYVRMEAPVQEFKVEPAARQPEVAPVQEEKLDFDAWHVMRAAKIPKAHHKEIIQADFKGRGLGQHESMKAFDAALAKYGIKLA